MLPCWYGLYARPWVPPTGAHPAPGLGPAEGVHSPGCPPPNAPRSSAMPADFLEHANNNHTKKGQTGLETGRSAGGLVQNVRKPSHEWGEPLPIQAASPIGEVGARQLSPPSITSTLVALQEFTAPRRQSRTVGSREASLRGPICNPFGQKIRGVLLVRHVN